MSFDPKVIEALALLRTFTGPGGGQILQGQVVQAINTLDNAGVFSALDEQTDYASAEEILAESAAQSLGAPLNAAEWGDTTRADMARHQGLITEPKGTPLDEPLFGPQAEVYGRLLGGTTGGGKSSPYHTPHDWDRTDRNAGSKPLGYTPYPSDPDPR